MSSSITRRIDVTSLIWSCALHIICIGTFAARLFNARPASVSPFLRELSDAQAAAVRLVEVFHPLEALRRVEIVDTPGLNSIRPARCNTRT